MRKNKYAKPEITIPTQSPEASPWEIAAAKLVMFSGRAVGLQLRNLCQVNAWVSVLSNAFEVDHFCLSYAVKVWHSSAFAVSAFDVELADGVECS